MGGSISLENELEETIIIEVFSGGKNPMHHGPDVEPVEINKNEKKKIETTNQWNIHIRFIAVGRHYIFEIKNDETLIIDSNFLEGNAKAKFVCSPGDEEVYSAMLGVGIGVASGMHNNIYSSVRSSR